MIKRFGNFADDFKANLISIIFLVSLQSKSPNHSFLLFVVNVFACRNAPKAGEFPASDGEFVKKRNSLFGINRIKHRLIKRIEFLVAAPTCARVENRVGRVAVKVRITRIDFAEIGEQRNNAPVFLVNSVADFVYFADFVPRKNVTGLCRF